MRTSEQTAQVATVEHWRQRGIVAWHERDGPMRFRSAETRSASAVFCWEMARMDRSSCAMAKGMHEEPSLDTNVPGGQAAQAATGHDQSVLQSVTATLPVCPKAT